MTINFKLTTELCALSLVSIQVLYPQSCPCRLTPTVHINRAYIAFLKYILAGMHVHSSPLYMHAYVLHTQGGP